jgi:hypothetical protein
MFHGRASMRIDRGFRSSLLTASLWAAGCGAAPASNPVASVEPPQATVVVGGTVELTGDASGPSADSGPFYGFWGVLTTCPYQPAPVQCCWERDPAYPPDPATCPNGWISGHSSFLPVTVTFHAPVTPQTVVLAFTSARLALRGVDGTSTVRIPITVVDPP